MPTIEEMRARRDRLRWIFALDSLAAFEITIKGLPREDLEVLVRWFADEKRWTGLIRHKADLVTKALERSKGYVSGMRRGAR